MSTCNYTITSRKACQSVGPSKDEKSPSRWALCRNDGVAPFQYWSYIQSWWEIIFLIGATIWLPFQRKTEQMFDLRALLILQWFTPALFFKSDSLSSGIVWWCPLFWALFAWIVLVLLCDGNHRLIGLLRQKRDSEYRVPTTSLLNPALDTLPSVWIHTAFLMLCWDLQGGAASDPGNKWNTSVLSLFLGSVRGWFGHQAEPFWWWVSAPHLLSWNPVQRCFPAFQVFGES